MIKDNYDVFEPVFKKLKRLPEYNKPFYFIDWAPLSLCNFSCSYCHPNNYEGRWPEHDIQDAKRFIDYISANTDMPLFFNINGGEPTLWKHLDEFCRHIKNKNPINQIRLITNGTRSKKWWLDRTDIIDQVIVSIHYGQTKNEVIVEKFNALHKTETDVVLHLMLDCNNFDSCVETYNYCKDNLDGPSLTVRPLRTNIEGSEHQPYTQEQYAVMRNLSNIDGVKYNPQQSVMQWRNTKTNEIKQVISIDKDLLMAKENNWKDWYCNIGLETIVVNSKGKIRIGSQCFKELVVGYLKDKDYSLPLVPIKCKYEYCGCLTDLQTTKVKDLPKGAKYIDAGISSKTIEVATRD